VIINQQQIQDERGDNMTNKLELEIAIKRSGLTKRDLAKKIGLSEMGLYKKINNITEFKASEIVAISEILDIKNKEEIFFKKNVI
jgi:predicted transcriptional regulator